MAGSIAILGVFVADTTYRADRLPKLGETMLGNSFALGPGGKGSNQAVAAARAGGDVHFISKLGKDAFADMALDIWRDAGVTPCISQPDGLSTGAAFIYVEEGSGNNAIIICPGAAGTLSAQDVETQRSTIETASIFITQLEQPMEAAMRGLEIARAASVTTILNPAPAAEPPDGMLALCDVVTPNEHEAADLTGLPVTTREEAEAAAARLLEMGVGTAILTLGENGALYHDGTQTVHVPAITAGPLVETTGAGDAFNGGLATALAEGMEPVAAVRFANATAALSVTKAGTAPSMPKRADIEALLRRV
ncbi:MAG: ribokinase [Rhodobacteraceae bacterium]|nr:ribokinase [Paracoccaceae bacterium]